MPTLSRLTLATLIAGLLLTGCAQHPTTRTATPSTTTSSSTTTTTAPVTSHRKTTTTTSSSTTTSTPENTGIAACDDYLSSYLACHRAAAIYAPDQLQSRYEAMRTSLLRDSQNPDTRPQLGARCSSLANQLREALHGKACASSPAPAGSAP